MSAARRRHSVSWLAAMTTQRPSLERYTFDGAMREMRVPLGSRTKPVFSYSTTIDSVMAKQASVIEASTTWPDAPRASRA